MFLQILLSLLIVPTLAKNASGNTFAAFVETESKREATMPKIKRWFHVSHDINADPEVWEMTDRLGDRTFRVWMELLSIADRNAGEIKGERRYLQVALSSKLRTNFVKVSSVI